MEVRLYPSQFLNDDLVLYATNEYRIPFNIIPRNVFKNGIALSSTYGPLNSFKVENDYLWIKTSNAPSDSFIYTVEFRLVIEEDLLIDRPKFSTSVENATSGIVSTSYSSLSFINDGKINIFDDKFSFYKKDIAINDNGTTTFVGKMGRITEKNGVINILIEDYFSKLNDPCYVFGTKKDAYLTQENAVLNSNDIGKPITFFIGHSSHYSTEKEVNASIPDALRVSYDSLHKAVCTNYNAEITTTNNRRWIAGRSQFVDSRQFTASAIDNTDSNYTRFTVDGTGDFNFFIGDTLINGTNYCRIIKIDRANRYIYTTKTSSINTWDALVVACVVVFSGNEYYYLLANRDYTLDHYFDPVYQKYTTYIQLANNFESNFSGLEVIDPASIGIGFRFNGSTIKHYEAISLISTVPIFTDDTTTINYNKNVVFSVPRFDEADFSPCNKYIQDICNSTFGFVKSGIIQNIDQGILKYQIFNYGTGNIDLDSSNILINSLSIESDFNDSYSGIVATNPDYNSQDIYGTTKFTSENLKAKFFHGIDNILTIDHVLADIGTRYEDIFAIKSKPRLKYDLETVENLDIAQDININGNAVKVLSIDPNGLKTKITAQSFEV